MKYGHFDDTAKEYVIHTPETPLPWINYLGNSDFFSLISNTGGGYHFYRDARLRRITRYRYNNVPTDTGGRCYYVRDGEDVWSPGFLPAAVPLDRYLCRHGLGYTIIEGEKNGVTATMTFFVPLGEPCEINRFTLKNHSDKAKSLQLYSALEWCLWDAIDDAQNFQRNLNTGEVEIDGSTVYHKTEFRERRDHYAYFSVNTPIDGFDTDRDTFLGRFRGWDKPKQVEQGSSANSVASGWSPMAGHRIEVTLAPGEERTFLFVLGYAEVPKDEKWEAPNQINKRPARELLARFDSEESVAQALAELAEYWSGLLSRFQVTCGSEELSRMVNIWNQYQCMTTFNLSRSASYFESGMGRGMGFRDSCQDLLGFVHLVPERARERIFDIASIQFEDGSTYHQYQPLTKRGNGDVGAGFNDDPLWLVACTAAYIRETGDAGILEAPVPFNNQAGSEKPLFEHLRRSIRYTMTNKGPHGLPLIGRADWNDCLNLNCFSVNPGESFQTTTNIESGVAESIFIAAMFVKYGEEYAELCERFGDKAEAERIRTEVESMRTAVLNHGWDGEWFLRAYDAFGEKVGSKENDEGSIFIEPQGFCVLAGIGIEEGFAEKALASAHKHLKNDYGFELLSPRYTKYRKELGEITSYPPSYKENGSVFSHNNPWVCIAEATIGNSEKAFEAYCLTAPAFCEDYSEIRSTEPYVYAQTIAGRDAPRYGLAKNSWLTGTAAWAFVSASQSILGIVPDLDGLRIKPCAPSSLGDYRVVRTFRDAIYTITVRLNSGETPGMLVDGIPADGDLVRFVPGKTAYDIIVTL